MQKMICKPVTMDAVKEKNVAISPSKAAPKKKKTPPSEELSEEIKPSSGIGTLFALEPRIMFDGAALATGAEVLQDTLTQDQTVIPGMDGETSTDSNADDSSDSDALWSSGLSLAPPSDRKEIVFIDTRVEDYQTLMEGIDPNADVILLDSTRDGVEQIAEALAGRSDIDAIHIVSHGNQAELFLSTSHLTLDSMSGEYVDELAMIGQALSETADILIYGCNFGEGVLGQAAAARLAQLTGGDVGASSDLSGSAALGGDWDLEVSTGQIESVVVLSAEVQHIWSGILGPTPPVLTNVGGDTLAYTEGNGAQVIEQGSNAAVTDVDSADFDTGTLTVSFQAGSDAAEDVLAIRDQGAGPTNITVAGSAVSYGGTQIGTFTGGSSGVDLVITLDANADATATSALVQNITYTNTDTDNPTLGSRTVRYVLTDGDGGTSANYDTTVTMAAINDAPVIADWYDSNWLYRKEIIIDAGQVAGDLSDYPVLVSLLSDADLGSFAQTDGDDILFTSVDGTTKLAHEIEAYDSGTGSLNSWVKTDLSGTQNTQVYVYYGNALASNQQDPTNVWDSNFQGVWHLNNTPTGALGEIQDSTANNNDGATEGGMNAADLVDAKIGKGLDFDEVDDLIRMPDSASLDSTAAEATFELWAWFDNAADGDTQIIMSSSNRYSGWDGYEWASQGDGDHFFYPDAMLPDTNYNLGPNPFIDQQWHHLAATMDFATKEAIVYVDGSPMTFTYEGVPGSWTTLTSSDDLLWGGNPDRMTRFFDGMMDEIRVSNVARSQEWIQTAFNNQDNPGTFFALSSAESRDVTLTDINEDDINPPGDTVATLIASAGGDLITDVDSGAVEGVAVIGVDDTNGQWQFDAGGGWTPFGAVDNMNAVLLDPTATVRFVPNGDYNGPSGDITFRAWDQTDGNPSGTTGVNVSSNGGITAYSSITDTASLNVLPVNDAPVHTVPGTQTVNEETQTAIPGLSVSGRGCRGRYSSRPACK